VCIGADFLQAMLATAPGQKLLTGRHPAATFFFASLFLQKITFLLRKINKKTASGAALFDSNMHQIVCPLQALPRPNWGSLLCSPGPQAVFSRPTRRDGRGGKERELP